MINFDLNDYNLEKFTLFKCLKYENLRKLKKLNKKLNPIFDPGKKRFILWNILNLLIVVFHFFEIPFVLSFNLKYENQLLKIIFFIFFFIDLLKNFNTAYFEKGTLIFSRKKIFIRYITSFYFYADLIAVIISSR